MRETSVNIMFPDFALKHNFGTVGLQQDLSQDMVAKRCAIIATHVSFCGFVAHFCFMQLPRVAVNDVPLCVLQTRF